MKAIFIMGSSGRIGFELTKHYLSKDYLVIAQCFRNCNKLKPLMESYSNISILRHDFIKSGAAGLVSELKKFGERLNAALVIHPLFHQSINLLDKSLGDLEKEINEVIRINLVIPLALVYGLLPFMKKGGSIILLTDLLPSRGLRIYPTLKPSLIQLASSAALQSVIYEAPKQLPKNVKYFAVAAGWLNISSLRDKDLKVITETVPLQRAGEIKELVNLLDYLIEEAPHYLTGALIRFSGGL